MPVERRRPTPCPFRPLDENHRAFPDHVVEAEIACFVRLTQPVAVDMIDRGHAGIVVVHQRVGWTGCPRSRAETAADRLHERGLARAQVTRQPDHSGSREPGADLLTEPAELARGRSEEHTSELQSQFHLVCRLLLEKKKTTPHSPGSVKNKTASDTL